MDDTDEIKKIFEFHTVQSHCLKTLFEVLKDILSMNCCFSLFLASYLEEYKLTKGDI